jgi:hypothetical protein
MAWRFSHRRKEGRRKSSAENVILESGWRLLGNIYGIRGKCIILPLRALSNGDNAGADGCGGV